MSQVMEAEGLSGPPGLWHSSMPPPMTSTAVRSVERRPDPRACGPVLETKLRFGDFPKAARRPNWIS